MVVEHEHVIFNGNVVVFASEAELKIGLFHSLSRKRDTLNMGLISFIEALAIAQDKLGALPAMTVGYTNKRTAEFAEKRLGMKVELVPRSSTGDLIYKVSCETQKLRDLVNVAIFGKRRPDR